MNDVVAERRGEVELPTQLTQSKLQNLPNFF